MPYVVYLLECSDGTYYTGITTDIDRRLKEHNESGRGAAYTRSRRPVTVVYQEAVESRSQALKREYVLRKLGREQKIALVTGYAPE